MHRLKANCFIVLQSKVPVVNGGSILHAWQPHQYNFRSAYDVICEISCEIVTPVTEIDVTKN